MRAPGSRLPDIRKIVTGSAVPVVPASVPGRDVDWTARALRSLAGLFVLTWAAALLIWRYARLEEKWTLQAERVG